MVAVHDFNQVKIYHLVNKLFLQSNSLQIWADFDISMQSSLIDLLIVFFVPVHYWLLFWCLLHLSVVEDPILKGNKENDILL